MTFERVGRVVLEDVDGQPWATCLYGVARGLREPSIVVRGRVWMQNRLEDGRWVYRETGPAGTRADDPAIGDFKYPAHDDWDGPRCETPVQTWDDVRLAFEGVCRVEGPVSVQRVRELYAVVLAAWPQEGR